MSTPEKPDDARGWLYVQKLIDEQGPAEPSQGETEPEPEWSADELLGMAEALAAKKPAAAAPDAPAAPLSPPQGLAPAPPPGKNAPVVPIRRPWRTVALLAAACFALFVIVKANQGPDIVTHPPSKYALAEAERDQAEVSCALKDWVACKANLDEAARMDPGGESEPRVRKAREEIAAGMAGRPGEAGGLEKPAP
ncbi:MAG TPA: hypothetical protein VK762_15420 [Polyangiaceae bacterium]|nr:hypothetical protein [Polyangiaceae bacterium]